MLSRVAHVEFFAVLPAGLYITVVGFMTADVALSPPLDSNVLVRLLEHVEGVQKDAGRVLLAIFAAYVAGSILRVLPVRWVEQVIPPFKSTFPSIRRLSTFRAEVIANAAHFSHDVTRLPSLGQTVPMSVFNHWKNLVCLNSADGFRYYQDFEARSRFFAGMFWASLVGVVLPLAALHATSWPPVLQLIVPSALLLVLFGSQFRRVRAQEAQVLYSVYSALCQDITEREHAE